MSTNNTLNVIPYIISQKGKLNDSQSKIADYITACPDKTIGQTSKEIADILELSEATIQS